jgi:glutathione S-transferase
MSTGKLIKLYGVPLSQPFRSCAWTMLQLEVPFQIEMAVPGMSNKLGTKHDNYRSLTPHRSSEVPLLLVEEQDNKLALTESPAIMAHLCERYGQQVCQLYSPPGSNRKALIDSYTHWHHSHTRFLARVFQTKVRADLKVELSDKDEERIQGVLQAIDSGWLQSSPFIGGSALPSIADVLAYGELSTVVLTKLISVQEYQNLSSWMGRMQLLPYHEEAHAALLALGDLTVEEGMPIGKRLGNATKIGLKAIADAQDKYQLKAKL